MSFHNFEGWLTPCPECKLINKPEEAYIDKDDEMVLRYICIKCFQKYERRDQLNQVSVVPLYNFRRPESKWVI